MKAERKSDTGTPQGKRVVGTPQGKRVVLIHASRCERGDHEHCTPLVAVSPRTVMVCACKCHKGTQLSLLEAPSV